jgi:hypothetical protein
MPGQGLYYRDDDALLDDVFNEDYVEKNFSSIPNEAACDRYRNRIMGSPQPLMSALNGNMWMYKAQWKVYTNGQCRKVLNSLSAVDIKTLPVKSHAMGHSCELIFSERRNVIHPLRATVVWEELKQREVMNEHALEMGAKTNIPPQICRF